MPAGRYSEGGVGDPPTPGTSKIATVGLVSASTNGSTSSMFAPSPFRISSGGRAGLPRRMP